MILKNAADIFVPFLWALPLFGTLVYFLVIRRSHGWLVAVRRLFSYRILWPLVGVVTVNLASASLVFIDPREIGVVVFCCRPRAYASKLMGFRLAPEGALVRGGHSLSDHCPVLHHVRRAYEGEELGDDAIRARTADGQLVIIDVTLLFRIRPEMAVNLHINSAGFAKHP
ncbi:MAG: hypothetical protein R3F53_22645 [Gammaproteobacteria bacterium]